MFLDICLKPSHPPSFLSNFVGLGFRKLLGRFPFFAAILEDSYVSGCGCSAFNLVEETSKCGCPTSVFRTGGFD